MFESTVKEIPRKHLLIIAYKESGMPRLDLMPMNNGREQQDALEWVKPMKEDLQVADLFEATIGGKFAALNLLEENKDSLTENICGAVVNTASEALCKVRKKKKPWMIDNILDLCDRRRSLKKSRKDGPMEWQCQIITRSIKNSEKMEQKKTGSQTHIKKLIQDSEQGSLRPFSTL